MSILYDPAMQQLADKEDEKQRAYIASEAALKREHELKLAKLKHSANTRHMAFKQVVVAIAKGPALLVLAFKLPGLVKQGKEVPEFLQKFMNL